MLNSERSMEPNSYDNFTGRSKLTSMELKNSKKPKTFKNEEQNSIAEILFDLGCLLATYDSKISKNEALDCIQRSLDIKILLLGPEHTDCLIINKKLNEIVIENSSSRANSRIG